MFHQSFRRFSSSLIPALRQYSVAGAATVAACSLGAILWKNDEDSAFGFPQFFPLSPIVTPTTLTERVNIGSGWIRRKEEEVKDNKDELFYGQCLKRQMFTPVLPYPAWNYNWDGRMTPGTTLEAFRAGTQHLRTDPAEEEAENSDDPSKPQKRRRKKKSRHIILVRHGQYEEKQEEKDRVLTPLGRFQARATGRRLAQIAQGTKNFFPDNFNGPCHIKAIHVSDMIRAKETAELIAEQVQYYTPKNKILLQPPDPLLNETLPAPMVPIRPDIPGATEEIDSNQERVEEAFRKYFYRDDGIMTDLDDETSNNELDDFEVIVCHGNMIRYFLCRALQLPPEAWLRFSTFNCSITYLVIRPEGLVVCRSVGDIGHLNYDQTTFSGYFGLKW
ncbi:histidine phosphatase superfamily branch 1 protein [Nitzschia inconspicua]|uniref:Serine/threonine-protein phosphatase PGAM5, mitochondrial n=1 Tax=Nitzschia inconspicua TaxID=303405 RepID=A0A9K3PMD9_9STRA|nr:histidine phosphatase superfamily branch 1 protein [Nitzschia inconspicua]